MALEDVIAALTKAVEANTKALAAGGGGAAAAGYKAKHSQEEVANAVGEHKEKLGIPATVAMITAALGREVKFKEITSAKDLDAVYDAAQKGLTLKAASDDV